MLFFLLNLNYLWVLQMFKTCNFSSYLSLGTKRFTHRGQQGMMLVEIILIAVFLATVAVGTSYFFTQTKVTMSSSSQVTQCDTIAKQALESVVSLGARLYGYKIHHTGTDHFIFMYEPLFIKDDGGVVKDVGSGSELSFPPEMYNELYKSLGITPPTGDPQSNTGKPLIGATYPFDISTSTLIVNSVNALQYLYNSDNGFFTENSGDGKMYTVNGMNSGNMFSILEKYGDQFDLENLKFYIKISPINLQTEKPIASPPSKILTRPRFHNPQGAQLSPALNVLGDPEIGFEITIMLKYNRNDQGYRCNASHRFAHQIKPITATLSKAIHAAMVGLTTGAGQDLLTNSTLLLTSCDTDGAGYDDITVTVNFNGIQESQQIGTVILCQMNSYCRSYGDASYNGCNPQLGRWQRCHHIQPTGPDQDWKYASQLTNPQVLEMEFSDMKTDRRYELNVGEFSMAGRNLRKKMVSRFYIDAIRPTISSRSITNDAVGTPDDGGGGRDYDGLFTNWIKPGDSTNKWVQCNQDTVEFSASIEDQFTHNLEKCELEGEREDGNGTAATSPTLTSDCGGELSGVQQGRQTITFTPKDTCGGTNTKDLVWDTDLPSKFETHDFPNDPEWLKSTDKDAYLIKTVLPAKDTAGELPKHYSVDCNDNFMGSRARKDGDGGQLDCKLEGSKPYHDDGCNPIQFSTKYHHVCGGTGSGVCKDTEWSVYVPHKPTCTGPSCKCTNVQCEPQLICCDGFRNECGTVGTDECETNSYPNSCSNPKGGGRTQQDSASGCPPLGLYDCHYDLPCNSTSPCSETGPTSACVGRRQGNSCSYSKSGTCQPTGSTDLTCDTSGTYTIGCDSGSCTVSCAQSCRTPCSHTCYDTCYNTCSQQQCDLNGLNCQTVSVQCNPYNCNPHRCHACDVYQYTPTPRTHTVSFSGACGVPSGGCPDLGVGGGNLSSERCDARPASCALELGVTPPPCDSTVECCPSTGDTFPSNSNCPSDCVKANGKACCLVSEGGDCTGQFCATNCASSGTCHVQEINDDGVCRPTCQSLAEAQGYTGDGASDTSNWTHTASTCASLNTQQLWGSDDWIKIPLIDNKEPQEVTENGGECCGRPPSACDPSKECCDTDKHSDLGGSNDNCPVNGECDTPNDGCKYGDKENATPPDVTWICKGENKGDDSGVCGTCDSAVKCCDSDKHSDLGGSNDKCPVNGECSPTGCDKGDPDPDPPDLTKTRTCKGKNGGDSATCEPDVTKVNAICNPTGCSEGTEIKHNDGTWICKGENGGDDAPQTPCPLNINGKCSPTGSGCSAGTQKPANPNLSLSSTGSWTCKGIGTGSNTGTCPRDGKCSDTGCAVGTKQDINTTQWECLGIGGGGKSGTCGITPQGCPPSPPALPPIDGVCNDTGCAAGNPDPDPPPNPGTWICKGTTSNGCTGKDSPTCGCNPAVRCCPGQTHADNPTHCPPPPSKAVCGGYVHGTTQQGTCTEGNLFQPTSTQIEAQWKCQSTDAKKTVDCPLHNKCNCGSCPQPPPAGCCDSTTKCCDGDTYPDNSHCPPPAPECGSQPYGRDRCKVGTPSLVNNRCFVHGWEPTREYEWTCESDSQSVSCFSTESVECCSDQDCLGEMGGCNPSYLCGAAQCAGLNRFEMLAACLRANPGRTCVKLAGCWSPDECIYDSESHCNEDNTGTTCQLQTTGCWKPI